MKKIDLVIHNAQLLSCSNNGKPKRGRAMTELGVIKDGALAIDAGKIIDAGNSSEILSKFVAEDEVDAKGGILMPGFVESHTHLVFAGSRLEEFEMKIKGMSYIDILASGGGILSTVKQTRNAELSQLIAESQKRLEKLIKSGITTCEIKTGYGLETETEIRLLQAILELKNKDQIDIVPTFMPAHAIPDEFRQDSDKYVELICEEMLPKALELFRKNRVEIFFADVFCEKNAFDLRQSTKILQRAKDLGFKLKAHVDEFSNLGAATVAISLGATSIDHLDKISSQEVRLLANSDTIGVITPTVNFHLGYTEFANARNLIDSGCAIAISTDYNPGSSPCSSMILAMAIACRYQKLLPSEVINACTINAAFAVGLQDQVGSIEVGKQADLLLFDTKDYREIVYELGSNPIQKIYKRGKAIIC